MLARFDGNLNSEELMLPAFSTFAPGEEPDVWPPLERSSAGPIVAGIGSALALVALLAWLTGRRPPRWWRALLEAGVDRQGRT